MKAGRSITTSVYFQGVETGRFEWSIFTLFVFSECGDMWVWVEYVHCFCIFRVWRWVGLSGVYSLCFVFSGCGDGRVYPVCLYFQGVETGGFEWSIFTVFVFSGCGDRWFWVEYTHRCCCSCCRVFRARNPGQYVHQQPQRQGQGKTSSI